MELLKSSRFKLPSVMFISDRNEIKELPIGYPFIYGREEDKEYIVKLLEWEVLYNQTKATGLPFNFRKILEEQGYELTYSSYCESIYMDYVTEKLQDLGSDLDLEKLSANSDSLKQYLNDATAHIDIAKLKELNVFPVWLDDIEKAVRTNLQNFAMYNPFIYNKRLDGMYGNVDILSPDRNLIIIDISSSIPKSISVALMKLAKWMGESFYADIIFTGKDTILIPYEELHSLDIDYIYKYYGNNQECKEFRKLLFGDNRIYKTAIVFGDNHSPCFNWDYTGSISREDAQKKCTWEIEKLISFHTTSNTINAGYSDFFSPKQTVNIKDWVEYLK